MTIKCMDLTYDHLKRILEDWKSSLDYCDVDGLVIRDNKVHDMNIIEGNHYKWSISYKHNFNSFSPIVKEVVWQVSKSGKLVPVAILEPLNIDNTTVKPVTCNNAKFVVTQ